MDEQKKIFLERQWSLLDGNKKLRIHIPTVCCTLIIATSAFYFNNDNFNSMSQEAAWLFPCFYLLLGVLGCCALRYVHRQYKYSNSKIKHLYCKFELDFLDDHKFEDKEKYETGKYLFCVGYVAIIAFSVIALFATLVM